MSEILESTDVWGDLARATDPARVRVPCNIRYFVVFFDLGSDRFNGSSHPMQGDGVKPPQRRQS